jgi:hypothetical protein
MNRKKPLTDKERVALDEGWNEVGESIAGTILVGGRTKQWAWSIIGPLGLYKRWMLDLWIERYQQEHPELADSRPKPPVRRGPKKKQDPSAFTKREQIHEALRMLNSANR